MTWAAAARVFAAWYDDVQSAATHARCEPRQGRLICSRRRRRTLSYLRDHAGGTLFMLFQNQLTDHLTSDLLAHLAPIHRGRSRLSKRPKYLLGGGVGARLQVIERRHVLVRHGQDQIRVLRIARKGLIDGIVSDDPLLLVFAHEVLVCAREITHIFFKHAWLGADEGYDHDGPLGVGMVFLGACH